MIGKEGVRYFGSEGVRGWDGGVRKLDGTHAHRHTHTCTHLDPAMAVVQKLPVQCRRVLCNGRAHSKVTAKARDMFPLPLTLFSLESSPE